MNSRILILSFIIATIFTVSLTENLETADGLIQSAKRLVYNIDLGETQVQTWTLVNDEDFPIILEIYATGKGSELLEYENNIRLEPSGKIRLDVFAVIPVDYEDNIEIHPDLFALMKGVSEGGATGIVVNVQMKTTPYIIIGDNPIYTPPVVEPKKPEPTPIEPEVQVVEPVKETMEERLEKIRVANEANKKDVPVETESVTDEYNEPILEPTCGAGTILVDGFCKVVRDNNPIVKECNWFEILLSWFGIGKC